MQDIEQRSKEIRDKLKGRKYVDDKNGQTAAQKGDNVVLASELPQPNRVLGRNSIMTRDFHENRLNVILDDQQVVENVYYG